MIEVDERKVELTLSEVKTVLDAIIDMNIQMISSRCMTDETNDSMKKATAILNGILVKSLPDVWGDI